MNKLILTILLLILGCRDRIEEPASLASAGPTVDLQKWHAFSWENHRTPFNINKLFTFAS